MPLILGTNSIKDTGYNVANSLRFNNDDSPRLSKTEDTDQSNGKKLTISAWCKLGPGLGSTRYFFGTSADGSYSNEIGFNANDKIEFFPIGNATNGVTTNRAFRDVSAWYHIVARLDTTQGTAANRIRLYVNGVQETSFSSSSYPSADATTEFLKNGGSTRVGDKGSGGNYYDGYLCELAVLDGQSLGPDSFGEFDGDSPTIWKPKDFKSDVTFGNNGFYYEFKETGTSANSSGLGADTSGSGNHMAATNLASTDQSTDTCTNNFATFNSLDNTNSQFAFSEGNLIGVYSGSNGSGTGGTSTFGVSQGKWYWELKYDSANDSPLRLGITNRVAVGTGTAFRVGFGGDDFAFDQGDGKVYTDNEGGDTASYGSGFSVGNIIGVALDLDNNRIYWSVNGTYENSGNPAGNSNGFAITDPASVSNGFYFAVVGLISGSGVAQVSYNFGSPPFAISSGNADGNGFGNFEYAVPSGFFSLCTKNLAEFG